ncbi:MAG: Flp family type IVb pilin [Gammaproteobacteria bacterium]
MKNLMKKFLNDESGATMVEYAVLVALISIAAIATIILVGQRVDDAFGRVEEALTGAAGGGGAPAP